MKIIPKDSQKTNGSINKYSKSLKKSKGVKKSYEKFVHNVTDFTEVSKQKDKKFHEGDRQALTNGSLNVKRNLKPSQVEKRKKDGTEWKTLKKIDYQRLETVLEEGQLSCEETSSTHTYGVSGRSDSESCIEGTYLNFGYSKPKKTWFHNATSFNDYSDLMEGMEGLQLGRGKKGAVKKSHHEPESVPKELNEKFAQTNRSAILNGMMEILPIFSNDKFVCSRDAISVAECEDLEPLDKNMPASEKTLLESKSPKDAGLMDVKPFFSGKSVNKSLNERSIEKFGNSKKIPSETKFRYEVLTDRSVTQKSSSPFINSLLILTSFADERNKLTENGVMSCNALTEPGAFQEGTEGNQSTDSPQACTAAKKFEHFAILKIFYAFVVTIFGLVSVFLGIAWRFYEPPCLLDYILEFVPFINCRRTYVQQFFDQLIKIMTNVFGGLESCASD